MTDLLKHMDIASRNQRLRETLEGMGLFVLPIYSESDPRRIDYIQVSVETPTHIRQGVAEIPSGRGVAQVVSGSNVARNVEAAESLGNNVVNLPTKL